MTEAQLQQRCVTWFHNTYPNLRGRLFMVKNETNKGAAYAPLGLVRSVSDLVFIDEYGTAHTIEMKAQESRHDVKHLRSQLQWLEKISNSVSFAGFIDSEENFMRIMKAIIAREYEAYQIYAEASRYYCLCITNVKTKTVKWSKVS